MTNTKTGKDLNQEAPRGPRARLGNYVILPRTIDKCRALLWGDIGSYHFDCPLDNMLFGFKGVTGDDFKAEIERGATDDEMVAWMDGHGEKKSADEVRQWATEMEAVNPYNNPEKRDWFVEQVTPLGLDPATTTLFSWLEADDKASYATAGAAA